MGEYSLWDSGIHDNGYGNCFVGQACDCVRRLGVIARASEFDRNALTFAVGR
jgi:hypothetical protein